MRIIWLLSVLLFPSVALSANWTIIPEKSQIAFTALYGKDKVEGHFPTLSGEVLFDPEQPERSKVSMRVDIASVASGDKDAQTYLPMAEWFAAKQFPQAVFETSKILKQPEGDYLAEGTLTIRDKTQPVSFRFTFHSIAGEGADAGKRYARVKGSLPINRLDFGVGQGEWAATDVIANAVDVRIQIEAVSQ